MLELTFEQVPGDLVAFNYYNAWAKPERSRQRIRSKFQVLAIAALAVIGIRMFTDTWDWSLTGMIGGAALLYVLTMDWFVKMRVNRHIDAVVKKAPEGVVTGPRTWKVDKKGITVVLSQGDQTFQWSKVRKVDEAAHHWMLYLDGKEALVLPKRALVNEDQRGQWGEFVSRITG